MNPIEKTVRDVVAAHGDPRLSIETEKHIDKDVFKANWIFISAGDERLFKVIDKRRWPVRIEHQHADPSVVTNHDCQTMEVFPAILAALLKSKETTDLLASLSEVEPAVA